MSYFGWGDVKDPFLWYLLFSELLGTFLLVTVAVSSCARVDANTPADVLQVAFTFGLVVAAVIKTLGRISRCHLNPAVTVGFFAVGNVSLWKTLLFVVAQCVGAIGGAAVVAVTVPKTLPIPNGGATKPEPGLCALKAYVIEALITGLLMLVMMSVDANRPRKFSSSLIIGMSVTAGHLCALQLTGASMNPARSLGPALIQSQWDDHWVYWAGPITGSIVAGGVYRLVFAADGGVRILVPPPEQQHETRRGRQIGRRSGMQTTQS